MFGNDSKAVERQHRGVAEMEAGERRSEDQKWLAAEQYVEAADFAGMFAALMQTARRGIVDGILRNHQNAGNGDRAEHRGENEHSDEAELPADQPRQRRTDHVAGMIEGLVAAVLPIEAGLFHHAERDAGHRGDDRGTGDGGGHLRKRHDPEILRQQDDRGGEHRAGAAKDDVGAFAPCRVHERADRCRHQRSGNAADRKDGADPAALPAVSQQKDADEWADAGLHVGHEEIQRFKRANAAR